MRAPPAVLLEPSLEGAADHRNPWDRQYLGPQGEDPALGHGSWELQEKPPSSLRSKLQALLTSPHSLRRASDCFGQRLDKIAAQSGLGCNSYRVRGAGKGTVMGQPGGGLW
uniref:Natriuretic peptide A n=1 Tax=Crocodylus porosus TaxID=8502 RepID=A0A7M4FAP3_CROPO